MEKAVLIILAIAIVIAIAVVAVLASFLISRTILVNRNKNVIAVEMGVPKSELEFISTSIFRYYYPPVRIRKVWESVKVAPSQPSVWHYCTFAKGPIKWVLAGYNTAEELTGEL